MATLAQRLQAEIDRANATTGGADKTVHDAVVRLVNGYGSGQGGIEKITWHQCPQAVRNYLAEVNYADDPDYTRSDIEAYALGLADDSNSKPIAETVSGDAHRNEVPNVSTPFSSATKAGTLRPLDWLRWINTTYITWVNGVNAFSSVADAEAYLASHPDTPNRTLFRIYPVEPPGTVPNDREFLILEDGTLKLFSYYDVGRNVRDLGGWSCDGGTIKYGMLIRGGDTNPADKHLMVDEIGIRTEVRLFEKSAQGLDHSVWDIDMIVNPTNTVIASDVGDKQMWRVLLEGIFDSVIHNRPVYFHCGQGADRTGNMAIMLEAILGVSESDIAKDYELTSFSKALRKRTALASLMDAYKAVPLADGLKDTLRDHAISFALSTGISIDKINGFRRACIQGNPETIHVVVPEYSVTKNAPQLVSFSNPTDSVSGYQGYETKVSVPNGVLIDSISVTMGGIDITDSAFTGTEVTPTVKKYAIKKTLGASSINNPKTEVIEKEGYGAVVTPNGNNHITGITVTMGGIDVSSSVVTLI